MYKSKRRYFFVGSVFLAMLVNDLLLGFGVLSIVTVPVLLASSILIKILLLIASVQFLQGHDKLVRRSEIDGLTQAGTRELFFNTLDNALHTQGGQRAFEHISIILFDLDDFKGINDNMGHHVGDKVLLQISNATKAIIRQDDTFARLGGEEFGIILPRTTLADANKLADRIREAIAATSPRAYAVSASFGVGTWSGTETVDHLYARVDALMYRAKANGKNTVVSE